MRLIRLAVAQAAAVMRGRRGREVMQPAGELEAGVACGEAVGEAAVVLGLWAFQLLGAWVLGAMWPHRAVGCQGVGESGWRQQQGRV